MILAIDPAKTWEHTGWAILNNAGNLINCGLGDPPLFNGTHVIIEMPQIYRGPFANGDPNDLAEVSVTVGRLMERYQEKMPQRVRPAQWKGQLPKEVTSARAAKRLTAAERDMVVRAARQRGLAHNIWDAVALGQWLVDLLIKQRAADRRGRSTEC